MEEENNEEQKQAIDEILHLTRENHRLLNKLYGSYRRGRIAKTIYWGIIIFLTFGAYYLIQPYVEKLGDAYSVIKTQVEGIHTIGETIKESL